MKYKIKGMDCDSCSKMIELDLEDAGFSNSKCSYQNETLEIVDEHDPKKVIEIVKKAGYTVLSKHE